jgi:hypothetical protein
VGEAARGVIKSDGSYGIVYRHSGFAGDALEFRVARVTEKYESVRENARPSPLIRWRVGIVTSTETTQPNQFVASANHATARGREPHNVLAPVVNDALPDAQRFCALRKGEIAGHGRPAGLWVGRWYQLSGCTRQRATAELVGLWLPASQGWRTALLGFASLPTAPSTLFSARRDVTIGFTTSDSKSGEQGANAFRGHSADPCQFESLEL